MVYVMTKVENVYANLKKSQEKSATSVLQAILNFLLAKVSYINKFLIAIMNCYQTKCQFQNVSVIMKERVHVMKMANVFAEKISMVQNVKDAKMGITCIPNA